MILQPSGVDSRLGSGVSALDLLEIYLVPELVQGHIHGAVLVECAGKHDVATLGGVAKDLAPITDPHPWCYRKPELSGELVYHRLHWPMPAGNIEGTTHHSTSMGVGRADVMHAICLRRVWVAWILGISHHTRWLLGVGEALLVWPDAIGNNVEGLWVHVVDQVG